MKLTKEARELYEKIRDSYAISDAAGLHILQTGCEAMMTYRKAQQAVRKYGIVTTDDRGRPKANPACAVERDSRAAMLACFKQLKIDIPIDENI